MKKDIDKLIDECITDKQRQQHQEWLDEYYGYRPSAKEGRIGYVITAWILFGVVLYFFVK